MEGGVGDTLGNRIEDEDMERVGEARKKVEGRGEDESEKEMR